jgi:hypothetical protein
VLLHHEDGLGILLRGMLGRVRGPTEVWLGVNAIGGDAGKVNLRSN